MADRNTRPYVVYPPGWPNRARARAYKTLEAAKRAARKLANETGNDVTIQIVARWGGSTNAKPIIVRPANSEYRELRDDVGLAQGIGMEF